ncbi:P-loop containing nucleoside triphosphate hydrolase protein, partial [Hanseniaspora valbyensis NRRL Y-1626]
PPPNWPTKGSIQFEHVSMAYREGLPLVLKDLTFSIDDGQKIALVGRTGCGKSSTVLTLFRLVELAKGKITIDGEDISKLGLYDLRRKLTIIPQDPVLFKKSIRRNLDPFGEYSDDQLWEALVNSGAIEAHLLEHVKSQVVSKNIDENGDVHKFHLDQFVQEDGINYSNGERQVLALTRAVVKKSKILVLDEATSSVDYETDAKIQSKIVSEFKDSTVITIAHRLNTILGYDKIMVLEKGEIHEFDEPLALFKNENSIFREMCEKASITENDFSNK